MIDGLRLTVSGQELRALLTGSIARHEESANWFRNETQRTADDASEDEPQLPEHMCEYEARRHTWRAAVLSFVREHVDAGETYRLSAADLEHGELLPPPPGEVEQQEYEERTRVGFNLERLVKSVDHLAFNVSASLDRRTEPPAGQGSVMRAGVIEETDEYRTSRIDVEGGPEIIQIERK